MSRIGQEKFDIELTRTEIDLILEAINEKKQRNILRDNGTLKAISQELYKKENKTLQSIYLLLDSILDNSSGCY